MVPVRDPPELGMKITDSTQVPAAATLFPQSSVSEKSPRCVIDEIERAELPMLRSSTDWGWLLAPTVWVPYCKETGFSDTAGADAGPILRMNASVFPPNALWNAGSITGKSLESVMPVA